MSRARGRVFQGVRELVEEFHFYEAIQQNGDLNENNLYQKTYKEQFFLLEVHENCNIDNIYYRICQLLLCLGQVLSLFN
jgi:hypothetical protein